MYTREQIQKIRDLINSHFEKGDVYDKLKRKIESENLSIEALDNETLSKILAETNLIDNLMLDIKHLDEIATYNYKNKRNEFVDPDKINYRSISIRIYKGKAFLEFIREDLNKEKYFQLFLSFCGQRFLSNKIPVNVDPEFNELFLFDLRTENQKVNVDLLTLSKLDHQIEISLILIDEKELEKIRVLYSQKLVEWRFLLSYGNTSLNIEMPYTYSSKRSLSENQFGRQSVGLIQIHMDLLPKSGLTLLPEQVLTTQLSREKALVSQASDRFHTYSQSWWNDYKELKLPVRPIKLYAESQDGIWRPSCTFICELANVRGIPSPAHAARFVSLIPFKRMEKGPQQQERLEIWHRFSTFLAIKNGDFEDHCLLLCSLLLGFNLDAYVVIGSSSDGAHGWVMTRQKKQNSGFSYFFWDSLTGHKREITDPVVGQLYKKIGCIFNHRSFYANIQQTEQLSMTDLNIEDYTKWKAIDPIEINNVRPQNSQLALTKSTLQVDELEKELEFELKNRLTNYRKILNLVTRFDEKLGGIMQIALINYEYEKITQQQFNQQEFQSALKSYIPLGHIFKSFPIQFLHMDTDRMLEAIKQAPMGAEVITSRGDQVYFAVKVKVELYPEDVYAVWVSISVRFHQIQ